MGFELIFIAGISGLSSLEEDESSEVLAAAVNGGLLL